MISNRIERRNFLKMVAAGVGGSMLPLPLSAGPAKETGTPADLPRFRITEPEWILHSDGTFDLIAGSLRLRNCRPTIDGQSIFVRNTFMGDSPKGKRIIYELDRGFVMLDLKINRGSVSIGAELSSISRAPFWFCPLGEARIEGVSRFYRQGAGQGGQSGFYEIQTSSAEEWGNVTGEQAWSYDSYLATALFSSNYETLVFSAYDHNDFIQKSSVFNRPHRRGLRDRHPDREELFFETGFVMENIPLKDDFIKLPDIYVVLGNRPFETMQHIAWNISENMVARKDTKTSYHWSSDPEFGQDFSYEMLQQQLGALDQINPPVPLQTVLIGDCYTLHGDWMDTNDRWPRSMDSAARSIFQRGYRAGIWLAPFLADERSKLFRSHPNWLIRDLEGNPVPERRSPGGSLQYALDASNPDVKRYLSRVFRNFRKMGFTFFKTDFLDSGLKNSTRIRRFDKDKTSVQVLVEILGLIREEIGAGSYWLAGNASFGPLIGLVDGIQIANELENEWTRDGAVNMFQESWNGQYFNNVFWQNDPGTLFLGPKKGFTDREKLSIARWNAFLGGAVHVSERIPSLSPAQIDLWKFLRPQDRPQSAELPFWGTVRKCKVAVRRFRSPRAWVALFMNDSDRTVEETFTMEEINGESNNHTFEWNGAEYKDYGNLNYFTIILNPHESRLLYLNNSNIPPQAGLSISGVEEE